MSEIIGIGACVMDTIAALDSFPKVDTKKQAQGITRMGGGPVSTGLVAAAKLGASAAYFGILSQDNVGEFLAEDFRKYGVDTEDIDYEQGYRAFTSNVWLDLSNGTRTCVFDKGNLPAFTLKERHYEKLRKARLLMVDGNEIDAAVDAAKQIKASGGKVLYDAGGLYPNISQLLELTDILIPSAEFAKGYTNTDDIGKAAAKLYKQYHPEVVVVTDGDRGGIFYDGNEVVKYPVFKVKTKDSNGAGDVFHGAFAAAVIKGFRYNECCCFASMVSSIKCTGIGARQSIPSYRDTIRELEKKGYVIDQVKEFI